MKRVGIKFLLSSTLAMLALYAASLAKAALASIYLGETELGTPSLVSLATSIAMGVTAVLGFTLLLFGRGELRLKRGSLTGGNMRAIVGTGVPNEETLLKDKHGFVLAGMEGSRYREYELEMAPGDEIFLYTDGVPEATDASDERC